MEKKRNFKDKTSERYAIGMARGYVVVDNDVLSVAKALEKMNIHVVAITPPTEQGKRGMTDEEIVKAKCGGRILITGNPDDFVEYAPIYDFGIISLKGMFLDTDETAKNKTARLISKTITENSLWSKRSAFLVTFDAKKKATVKDLQ